MSASDIIQKGFPSIPEKHRYKYKLLLLMLICLFSLSDDSPEDRPGSTSYILKIMNVPSLNQEIKIPIELELGPVLDWTETDAVKVFGIPPELELVMNTFRSSPEYIELALSRTFVLRQPVPVAEIIAILINMVDKGYMSTNTPSRITEVQKFLQLLQERSANDRITELRFYVTALYEQVGNTLVPISYRTLTTMGGDISIHFTPFGEIAITDPDDPLRTEILTLEAPGLTEERQSILANWDELKKVASTLLPQGSVPAPPITQPITNILAGIEDMVHERLGSLTLESREEIAAKLLGELTGEIP